jgi:hypothetical protein
MIGPSINKFSANCVFKLNGVAVDYSTIIEHELALSENKHDLLIVTMAGVPAAAVTDYIGVPVSFSLGEGFGTSQKFVGYVSYVEPMHNAKDGLINKSPIQLVKIYCIGASMVMKEVRSKVWENPTLSEIVTFIAETHGFSADYPKETYRPPRLVQSNESDWSFLNRVCKKFGLSFSLHGTHLHLWDRNKFTGRTSSFHRALTSNKTQDNRPFYVLNFEATLGKISSSGDRSRSVVTVLDSQNNIHVVVDDSSEYFPGSSDSPKLFKKPLTLSLNSLEEGIRTIDSYDKYNSIYNAKINVMYGGGAVPGGILYLDGFSSKFDGFWYISDVTHFIKSENYVTELVLAKSEEFSEIVDTSNVTSFKEPPEYIMNFNEQWVSSTVRISEYA